MENKYVIMEVNEDFRIYDDIEKAKRELEVRFLEDETKKYIIAKVVGEQQIKMEVVIYDKPKRSYNKKFIKAQGIVATTSPVVGNLEHEITTNISAEVPITFTVSKEAIKPQLIAITNPVTGDFTIEHRCHFDNKPAVKSVDLQDGLRWLCAEHAV